MRYEEFLESNSSSNIPVWGVNIISFYMQMKNKENEFHFSHLIFFMLGYRKIAVKRATIRYH